MKLVKLNAISSTNTYLRDYTKEFNSDDDVLVWALEQNAGRGQRGSHWESQPGKNLTFSVFKRVAGLRTDRSFYVTMATALAVYEVLYELGVQHLSVKWPNDILAGKSKICGVLIESIIRSDLHAVIVGVGLNVNQIHFKDAPRATSVLLETGIKYDLEEMLDLLIHKFHHYAKCIEEGNFADLKAHYEQRLFRRDKVSTFKLKSGELITGIIREVSKTGKLIVQLEDELYREFDLKELKLLY